jgi:hypothetical protein
MPIHSLEIQMSTYHVQALFAQFPWLADHIDSKRLSHAVVERADASMLEEADYNNLIDADWKILLLDANGKVLYQRSAIARFFGPPVRVHAMLDRLSDQKRYCTYVVKINGAVLRFYRPPKDRPIVDLLKE